MTDQLCLLQNPKEEEEDAVSTIIVFPDIPLVHFVFIIFVSGQHETHLTLADMKELLQLQPKQIPAHLSIFLSGG